MDSDGQDNCVSNPAEDQTARIRQLNDLLRVDRIGGKLCITHGICSLGTGVAPAIIEAVTRFADFSPDNDPYGEHDFAALTVLGHRINWKIDYYNNSMTAASPDPANPSVTTRVLTIMLASEY